MRKQSSLNVIMFLISIVGAIAAFGFGELLLVYLSYLPPWVQCGVYLLFVAVVCCVVLLISEKIQTGNYLLKHKREFGFTAGKAALIFLPAALALGIITQLIYSWGGISISLNPKFQGTMIVCDISDSMNENDPYMHTVEAVASYIDTVPLGEYLGVLLFNDSLYSFREYSLLESEEERGELLQSIKDELFYSGGTDIEEALLTAISEMRQLEDPDWPGLILLFSDGQSDVDYSRVRNASIGDVSNPRNRIPVNTIYFSISPLGGYQMNTIAEETGGRYFHLGVREAPADLRNVFSRSRSEFRWNTNQHLIKSSTWSQGNTVAKVILRIVLLAMWGAFLGVFVVIFLNNNRLIKHFLIPKIVVAVICSVVFTVILLNAGTGPGQDAAGKLGRALLAAGMCIVYLPTYRWD